MATVDHTMSVIYILLGIMILISIGMTYVWFMIPSEESKTKALKSRLDLSNKLVEEYRNSVKFQKMENFKCNSTISVLQTDLDELILKYNKLEKQFTDNNSKLSLLEKIRNNNNELKDTVRQLRDKNRKLELDVENSANELTKMKKLLNRKTADYKKVFDASKKCEEALSKK